VSAQPDRRAGTIALIGAPNAGKSTLLNALLGAKLAIVSDKPQTSRRRLAGIVVAGTSQLVLVDTPGIFAPRRRLDRAMVEAAWRGAEDCDLALLVVDAARWKGEETAAIVARLERGRRRLALALNKIDQVKRESLLAAAAGLHAALAPERVFMISALKGDGVEDLKRWLAEAVPSGPWLYPEDQLSDASERVIAAELTREQLYLQLRQELPYAATVTTEQWLGEEAKLVRIRQTVTVARPGQKGIVIGAKGARLKAIRTAAADAIAAWLGRRVDLTLHVRVREAWDEDPETYRDLGLDRPPD